MTPATESLLTAKEYGLLPDSGKPSELVRGRIEWHEVATPLYGWHCSNVIAALGKFVREQQHGRMCTRSGVITERDPDTVRAADICYYSYVRVPRGPLPDAYLDAAPELVFLVYSRGDRWGTVLKKVGEFLAVGVIHVCVSHPDSATLSIYHDVEPMRILTVRDDLTLPDLFGPDFRVPVSRFFAE
jgi:Uma2 family endonuclease